MYTYKKGGGLTGLGPGGKAVKDVHNLGGGCVGKFLGCDVRGRTDIYIKGWARAKVSGYYVGTAI